MPFIKSKQEIGFLKVAPSIVILMINYLSKINKSDHLKQVFRIHDFIKIPFVQMYFNFGLVLLWSNVNKASFSFHKLIPKTLKWLPYLLICHCTSRWPWFIILDKKNVVNVFVSLSYITRISNMFIANAMWTHSHVMSKM